MSALGEYYRAQTQEKIAGLGVQDAQRLSINAQTAATNANTGEIAADAASRRDLQGAQAGLQGAEANATRLKLPGQIDAQAADTNLTNTRATLLPGESAASTGAQQANTQATLFGLQPNGGSLFTALQGLPGFSDLFGKTPAAPGATPPAPGTSVTTTGNSVLDPKVQHFAVGGVVKANGKAVNKGVVGKGKPTDKDTVPAMLAPGEAVLNRGATEHMGKGVIDHLNRHGLMRMAAQDEVHGHIKALAAATGPKGKPAPGTVAHFLTGGMVPGTPQPAGGGGGGLDLMSMIAAMGAGAGAGGGGAGAPASSAVAGGSPSAPSPAQRRAPAPRHKR